MSSKKGRIGLRTIGSKLVFGLLVLTVPMVCMLIYNNIYAISVVRAQVADSYSKMMQLYMGQIDNELNDIDKYMNNLIALDQDIMTMTQTSSDDSYYKSKILLSNKMPNDLLMYPSLQVFTVYSVDRDDYLDIYRKQNYEELENTRTYLKRFAQEDKSDQGYKTFDWTVEKIGGEYYFIHVMKYNKLYLAATIASKNLMIPLNLINFGERGGALFASAGLPLTNSEFVEQSRIELQPDMSHYYLSGEDNKYLIVGQASKKGYFSLVAVIPDDQILQNLPTMQQIVYVFPFISISLIPIGLFLLRRTILSPLNRLVNVMKRIRGGDLDTRLNDQPTSTEFQIVNETFNQMIEQIHGLKINVYEEQLSKQNEELHRLKLQINPHFFMNSLTILYNLAKMNKIDLLKEMTLRLIQHFRFMFRSNLDFVSLNEELDHTRNYLSIQELRFPGSLTFNIALPDFLKDTPVPPLAIQTFVENIAKHAMTLDERIFITIEVDLAKAEAVAAMIVRIQDTGKGFPADVLEQLNKGVSLTSERGEHIGIWNVQRRIRLLYGDTGQILFANLPSGGASVELVLPLDPIRGGGDAYVSSAHR